MIKAKERRRRRRELHRAPPSFVQTTLVSPLSHEPRPRPAPRTPLRCAVRPPFAAREREEAASSGPLSRAPVSALIPIYGSTPRSACCSRTVLASPAVCSTWSKRPRQSRGHRPRGRTSRPSKRSSEQKPGRLSDHQQFVVFMNCCFSCCLCRESAGSGLFLYFVALRSERVCGV